MADMSTSNTYGITRENLLKTLPVVLRGDESMQALADAVAQMLERRGRETDLPCIYSRIDQLDGALLDILAVDLKVDWYDAALTLEQKRAMIRNSLRVHQLRGTKTAVELAISDAFGDGKVREWFEYGGAPGHFRVTGIKPESVGSGYDAFMGMLNTVKRQSAVLDGITIQMSAEQRLYTGFAVRVGRKFSVDCEIPAEMDVMYLVDENGDILTDEAGNRLIDTEEA